MASRAISPSSRPAPQPPGFEQLANEVRFPLEDDALLESGLDDLGDGGAPCRRPAPFRRYHDRLCAHQGVENTGWASAANLGLTTGAENENTADQHRCHAILVRPTGLTAGVIREYSGWSVSMAELAAELSSNGPVVDDTGPWSWWTT